MEAKRESFIYILVILHKFLFQGIILIGFILSIVTIISADGTDGLTADDGSDQLSLMMMGHHHSENGMKKREKRRHHKKIKIIHKWHHTTTVPAAPPPPAAPSAGVWNFLENMARIVHVVIG